MCVCVCVFVCVCTAGASGSSSARTFPELRAPGQRATQVSTSKRSPPIMSLLCVFVYASYIHVFMLKPGQHLQTFSPYPKDHLSACQCVFVWQLVCGHRVQVLTPIDGTWEWPKCGLSSSQACFLPCPFVLFFTVICS